MSYETNRLFDERYKGKLATQAFYYQRLLPRAQAHAEALSAGASTLMDIAVEQF